MKKQEVIALLEQKLDEVFADLQEKEGITAGDIDMEDAFALDEITAKTADLIIKIIDTQKEDTA